MLPLGISRHDPMGNAEVRGIRNRVIYSQIPLTLSFRVNEDYLLCNAVPDVDGTQGGFYPNTFTPLQRILRH